MFWVFASTLFGMIVGRVQGRVTGYTAALVPVTMDPYLEAAYRRALGDLSPEQQRDFETMMQRARDRDPERDEALRWLGETLTWPVPGPVLFAARAESWPFEDVPELPVAPEAATGRAWPRSHWSR